MLGRSRLMMAVAMMGAFSAATHAVEMVPVHNPRRAPSVRDPAMTYATTRGKGTTAAQIKRASKKARNVKRHKKHA